MCNGYDKKFTFSVPTLQTLAEARRAERSLVVAQLGQSLDGRVATASGHSHYINGDAALSLLHALRASVDAVVVGVGTALADDPQLTVRRVDGANPARVLIDRTRRGGSTFKLLREDGARRIVFGRALPDDPRGVESVVLDGVRLAPKAILEALAERGMTRVLIEGGARTVSGFLEAGALDRLCLLVGPVIIGSGPVGLTLPPIETLDEALRPAVETVVLPGGDVLLDCALRSG